MTHYEYLDHVMPNLLDEVGAKGGWEWNAGIVLAHGDKGYGYRERWADAGIPFEKGMAVYLLSYVSPFGDECRHQDDGTWVDPGQWVIDNFSRFEKHLPDIK